jgi:DNA mismatch repair protein MutS
MILANHTLKQLNMIADHENHVRHRLASVTSLLNTCCTPMGKRKFQYQMTNPVFDIPWLNREYDMIHLIQSDIGKDASNIMDIRRRLRSMKDMAKFCRQLISKRLYPSAMTQLFHTLTELGSIHETYIMSNPILYHYLSDTDVTQFHTSLSQCIRFLETTFFLESCAKTQSMQAFDENIIRPGISADLDTCYQKQKVYYKIIQDFKRIIDRKVIEHSTMKEECIKLHETEKSGISFQITKKRAGILKTLIAQNADMPIIEIDNDVDLNKLSNTIYWKDLHIINASTSYDEVDFAQLKFMSRELLQTANHMNEVISSVYLSILNQMTDSWYEKLEHFAKYIATLDVIVTKAHIAKEYNYCRPEIVDSDKSFVNVKNIRHVLIEHLNTNELYVTNDVELGEVYDGILLYGTNAVGKTSLIRALGIAVILAQSGCYVPCSQFQYYPYQSIFSRILGNDNIFKGLSTFAVEMSELRLILKMSNQHSLILGDELCSGTEVESALAIFMTGLMELHEKRASFIFATHFHEILRFDEWKMMDRIQVKHMSVRYDAAEDCLIYDRLLKDGPGNGTYGIEVAKSMYMDVEFLERAYQIRHKYFSEMKTVIEQTPTAYNTKKILGVCELCKKQMGDEIHHMQYQRFANNNGYIEQFHKNHPANLMSICQTCHDSVHKENGVLVRKKTTRGYKIKPKN